MTKHTRKHKLYCFLFYFKIYVMRFLFQFVLFNFEIRDCSYYGNIGKYRQEQA